MSEKKRPPPAEEPDPLDDRTDETAPYAMIGRAVVAGVAVLAPALREGFRAFAKTLVRGQVERSARQRRRAGGK